MSNGQTPEQVLDALAGQVRFFTDQEIPNVAAWNENPTVQQQSLLDIGDFFTDLWTQVGTVTGPNAEWIPWPSASYVSPTSFTVAGNQTTLTPTGTRIRYHLGLQLGTAAVSGTNFDPSANLTTITIDQSALTIALTGVDYGFVRASVPKIGPNDLQLLAVNTGNINDGAVTNAKITGPIDQSKIGNPPWSLVAGELVNTDPTTYPSYSRIAPAVNNIRWRLIENPQFAGAFAQYVNLRWSGSAWVQDLASRPSWYQQFHTPNDTFSVGRLAPGGSGGDLLALTAHEAFFFLNNLTVGSASIIKARFGDAGTGDYQWRTNCGLWSGVTDDPNKPSWAMRMGPASDDFSIFRGNATSGTPIFTQLFHVDRSRVYAASAFQTGAPPYGYTVLSYAGGHPGYMEWWNSDNTRSAFLGWEYNTGHLEWFFDHFTGIDVVGEFCEIQGRRHGWAGYTAGAYNLDAKASLITCDASGGRVNLYLPLSSGCRGRIYYIVAFNATNDNVHDVVIYPQASENISGAGYIQLQSNRAKTVLFALNWWDYWFRLF